VLTLDRLSHTHRSRDVEAEDDGDILASELLIYNLGSSLLQIVDSIGGRDFFFVQHDDVLMAAELAIPNLFLTTIHLLNCFDLGVDIEDSLTFLTYLRVSSSHLSSIC
jgi:hypothetical protein